MGHPADNLKDSGLRKQFLKFLKFLNFKLKKSYSLSSM